MPTTLGWSQLSGTKLAPDCPNDPTVNGTCAAVIDAWGGAAADTQRNRMIIWGGGHTDYSGNEAYAMDLNALTMSRVTGWTTNPNDTPGTETQSDGRPTSRHTYDNLVYLPNVDKMFSFGGALAGNPSRGSSATWMLDMPTLQWTRKDPNTGGINPDGGSGIGASVYDPNTNLVFVVEWVTSQCCGSQLWKYDAVSNTYTELINYIGTQYHFSGVIDSSRKLMFIVGDNMIWQINIAGPTYTATDITSQTSGCSTLAGTGNPGLAFDTKQNLVVGWIGSNNVYLFNPDSANSVSTNYGTVAPRSCLAVTSYTGGPPPPLDTSHAGSTGQQSNGTNGRFAYFPLLNAFGVVNDWQADAYLLRLTPPSGTPPPPPSACDVTGDGVVNVADVQKEVNMDLQIIPCTNPSGTCNVASVQKVVNAALGGPCVTP